MHDFSLFLGQTLTGYKPIYLKQILRKNIHLGYISYKHFPLFVVIYTAGKEVLLVKKIISLFFLFKFMYRKCVYKLMQYISYF